MSYLAIKEYEVVPNQCFELIHSCAGCGEKSTFITTNAFRVNVNGNCIDVWLIYQCEKCKHTWNIPIYERIRPKKITQKEYEKFLANDYELAFQYGTDLQFMKKNNIEVEWSKLQYHIVGEAVSDVEGITELNIKNASHLKIRTEKVLSEIIDVSRQEIRRMQEKKQITFEDKSLGKETKVCLCR